MTVLLPTSHVRSLSGASRGLFSASSLHLITLHYLSEMSVQNQVENLRFLHRFKIRRLVHECPALSLYHWWFDGGIPALVSGTHYQHGDMGKLTSNPMGTESLCFRPQCTPGTSQVCGRVTAWLRRQWRGWAKQQWKLSTSVLHCLQRRDYMTNHMGRYVRGHYRRHHPRYMRPSYCR